MRTEEMVIVSVDDHVVEPPDVFEGKLEARYRDLAPRLEHASDGTDVWHFLDIDIPAPLSGPSNAQPPLGEPAAYPLERPRVLEVLGPDLTRSSAVRVPSVHLSANSSTRA